MNRTVSKIAIQWLQCYNRRVVQLVATLLHIHSVTGGRRKCLTIISPTGAILQNVTITPATTVAEIIHPSQQLTVGPQFETPLKSTLVLWDHVDDGDQFVVTIRPFAGIWVDAFGCGWTSIDTLSWHPSGKWLASGALNCGIQLWDVSTTPWTEIKYNAAIRDDYPFHALSWNPDGTKLACIMGGEVLQIFAANCHTGLFKLIHKIRVRHAQYITCIGWDSTGKFIAAGSDNGVLQIYTTQTGTVYQQKRIHTSKIYAVDWHPSKQWVASGSGDNTIRIWDVSRNTYHAICQGHSEAVRCLSWHPDGATLASGSNDRTIRIWNMNGGCINKIISHVECMCFVAWNSTGTHLVSASCDCAIQIWGARMVFDADCTPTSQIRLKSQSYIAALSWRPHRNELVRAPSMGAVHLLK